MHNHEQSPGEALPVPEPDHVHGAAHVGTPRAVTLRSVVLGLLAVAVICGLTPYNDHVLNNTFFVGNNLPLGLLLLTFLFVVFVNGALSRFAPRYVFSSGEIAVAFSMGLVSCCLPSSGLMRYFVPSLVMQPMLTVDNAQWRPIFESMDLPAWIFPTFSSDDRSTWATDPVVLGFYFRWTDTAAYPYLAWLRPAVTWGIFFACLYLAMGCMVLIVRRQWVENERLAFPLAQIQLALIEQPSRGRWLNRVMSHRRFWIGFGAIFLLHVWNGGHRYFVQYVPEMPIGYDLRGILAEPPWVFTEGAFRSNRIFFSAAGVTYFVSGSVAFSLWAFFLLRQVELMMLGLMTGETATPGRADQHVGGVIALTIMTLWIGRAHWASVVRAAFGAARGVARDPYLPLGLAFWGFVAGCAGMVLWLFVAGCTFIGAMVIVAMLVLAFFAITRIVAEAGLIHGQVQVPLIAPWTMLASYGGAPVPVQTFFYGNLLDGALYDAREVMPVYASHSLKLADDTTRHSVGAAGPGWRFPACLALALLVGYCISFYASLRTEYTHAFTLDASASAPINSWGVEGNQRRIINRTVSYAYNTGESRRNHSPAGHLLFGGGFTAFLSIMRLRFTGWPLHPIGYLMVGTFPGQLLWFSFFLGWLAKWLVLQFGGAGLYTSAKPFVIGVILGEAVAAAGWMGLAILLSSLDLPFHAIRIMPF